MRRDALPVPEGTEATGYTFHFQISNSGARQACSVQVIAPSLQDATHFFRQNLPMIETMARDGLARGSQDKIRLSVARRTDG
jgi:hypothetical protein